MARRATQGTAATSGRARQHETDHRGEGLARALGWASVGLGGPMLLATERILRVAGLQPATGAKAVVRAVGVREFGAAAGLLTKPKNGAFLWARVAGDVMDLALLGRAMRERTTDTRRAKAALGAVAGITALDLVGALRRTQAARAKGGGGATAARSAVTVNRPRSEVYEFWRDFERLPQFMFHLESVTVDTGRSHWVSKAPFGKQVKWTAEITDEVPGSRISWQSLPGSDVPNRGTVTFTDAPGGHGTEVLVELEYDPPAGALGSAVAKLFGEEPDQQLSDDLRRFKQVMEVGEIVRSAGSPEGSKVLNQVRQHDAQPPLLSSKDDDRQGVNR